MKIKKVLTLMLTIAIGFSLLSACGKDKESSAEMPYGATMREDKSGEISVLYDKRFLNEREMTSLINYFYSIETNDAQLFLSVQPTLYTDYLCDQNGYTSEKLVRAVHDDMENALGSGFTVDYIEVTDCNTENADISNVIEMLDGIYEAEGKSFSDTLKACKYISYTLTVTSDDSQYTKDNQILYIIEDDDSNIYIL